jgi:hypothetical protein
VVACHIYGQPLSLPGSSLCHQGLGDVPFAVMKAISDNGFLIGNHSFSHIPLSLLGFEDIIHDFTTNQALINALGQKLGLPAIRCRGLDCTNITVLNGQPGLPNFTNPINQDVGGGFVVDNTMPIPRSPAGSGVGGDWWFYQEGFPAQMAGYYYVRDITALGSHSGVIVLLHARTEIMTGGDGSRNFPVNVLNSILTNMPSSFPYAPLDGIPGLSKPPHRDWCLRSSVVTTAEDASWRGTLRAAPGWKYVRRATDLCAARPGNRPRVPKPPWNWRLPLHDSPSTIRNGERISAGSFGWWI